MKPSYADQRAIFDPEKFTWTVHVIGLGGIGSALLFPLVKLGARRLEIWDDDAVEPHNIPAQLLYRPSDIGTSKAKAVCSFFERQEADCEIVPHEERATSSTQLEGVVIAGVDSMASRQTIWDGVKFNPMVPLFMDGRIGGEQLQLLTLNPSNFDEISEYEQWLFPDSDAAQLPCAARTVIHPPTVLAGLMITQLTLFLRDERYRVNIMAGLKGMVFQTS